MVFSIANVPWSDVETVFGTRGDPARCWCQFFKMPNAEWWNSPASKKSTRLHGQVTDDPVPPGLLAYLDGEPVGWCAVEPRTHYPLILRSKVVTIASTEDPDDESVWAISCFVVRVGKRRKGVGQALARAAVDWPRAHAAGVLTIPTAQPRGSGSQPCAAASSAAMSSFDIWSMACMTRPAFSRSGSVSSSPRIGGTICQDRPYLSLSQPH